MENNCLLPSGSLQIAGVGGRDKRGHHNTMQYLPRKRQAQDAIKRLGGHLTQASGGKGEVLGRIPERVRASSASCRCVVGHSRGLRERVEVRSTEGSQPEEDPN